MFLRGSLVEERDRPNNSKKEEIGKGKKFEWDSVENRMTCLRLLWAELRLPKT